MKAEPDIAPKPAKGCGRASGPAFFMYINTRLIPPQHDCNNNFTHY